MRRGDDGQFTHSLTLSLTRLIHHSDVNFIRISTLKRIDLINIFMQILGGELA